MFHREIQCHSIIPSSLAIFHGRKWAGRSVGKIRVGNGARRYVKEKGLAVA